MFYSCLASFPGLARVRRLAVRNLRVRRLAVRNLRVRRLQYEVCAFVASQYKICEFRTASDERARPGNWP